MIRCGIRNGLLSIWTVFSSRSSGKISEEALSQIKNKLLLIAGESFIKELFIRLASSCTEVF